MKQFDIPTFYKSSIISEIKNIRKTFDPKKKDLKPTYLNFGKIRFQIARHFGFCFGVENAIEISYRALSENPDKRIFLLSQMIHNQAVNKDLQAKGINFLMDTEGNSLHPWDDLNENDVVIIPAFGTTLETEKKLLEKGISPEKYNTTCPFVERVWKKSEKLGADNYSIIIHGKYSHEETRATFSHSTAASPSVIIKDMTEAEFIADVILEKKSYADFYEKFKGKYSTDFNAEKDLQKLGVVNQTTMLATETQAIAEFFKQTMIQKYGFENYKNHFADTRDTLCYATNENQDATYGLLETDCDLAIVVGGYNSSNTSHLVELLERKFPTYFISSDECFDDKTIEHFDYPNKKHLTTAEFLPQKDTITIAISSGASCPDTLIDKVLTKILNYYNIEKPFEEVMAELQNDLKAADKP